MLRIKEKEDWVKQKLQVAETEGKEQGGAQQHVRAKGSISEPDETETVIEQEQTYCD